MCAGGATRKAHLSACLASEPAICDCLCRWPHSKTVCCCVRTCLRTLYGELLYSLSSVRVRHLAAWRPAFSTHQHITSFRVVLGERASVGVSNSWDRITVQQTRPDCERRQNTQHTKKTHVNNYDTEVETVVCPCVVCGVVLLWRFSYGVVNGYVCFACVVVGKNRTIRKTKNPLPTPTQFKRRRSRVNIDSRPRPRFSICDSVTSHHCVLVLCVCR